MKQLLQLKEDLEKLRLEFNNYRINKNHVIGLNNGESFYENLSTSGEHKKYEQRSVKEGFFRRSRNSFTRKRWHR